MNILIKKGKELKNSIFRGHLLQKINGTLAFDLLISTLRKNIALLLPWFILFNIILGNFGNDFGVPSLFLNPEYLNKTNFWSFFIVGVAFSQFTITYHTICYVLFSGNYPFLGAVKHSFFKFSINNSVFPLVFLITYILCVSHYQLENQFKDLSVLFIDVIGFLLGFCIMLVLLYMFFSYTHKSIFVSFSDKIDKQLKHITINRRVVLDHLKETKSEKHAIHYFFDSFFTLQRTANLTYGIDRRYLLKVFDENHFNLIITEFVTFLLIVFMSFFMDYPLFQIPAAASGIFILTFCIKIIAAISYWFRGWSFTAGILLLFLVNLLLETEILKSDNYALGLDYNNSLPEYSQASIEQQTSPTTYLQDKESMISILKNWKKKQSDTLKPKMVFLCVSGGGQRAALWTFKVLQAMDSITDGKFMEKTMLITGASGGSIGAAYFRELSLRKKMGENIHLNDPTHLTNISKDILNSIIFHLLVNDMLIRFQYMDYKGESYLKDRGIAFENTLNNNTDKVLDKSLQDYALPEQQSLIPVLILAPIIINDGKKMFISSQDVSFMNNIRNHNDIIIKIKGVDFLRFFEQQNAGNLRYLTALRMNATFPYISPKIQLPTSPSIELMDAGVFDNFGVSDAIQYMYVFRQWIADNTNGVVFVIVRDYQKIENNVIRESNSLLSYFSSPISGVYNNLENIQDINNDSQFAMIQSWFPDSVEQISFEYNPHENRIGEAKHEKDKYAPLSWRLTEKEKKGIIQNIKTEKNIKSLLQLKKSLE